MWNSAEIRKSYYLSTSVHRLVLTPLVLFAFFIIGYKFNGMHSVAYVSIILYSLITIYYGGLCAASSFSQELGLKTWDNIRLSSLSAWDVTLGKLFGSTLFAWYGGLLALTGLLTAMALHGFTVTYLVDVFLLLIAGLLVQAMAMVIDLQSLQTAKGGRSIVTSVLVLLIAFLLANNMIVSLVSLDLTAILKKNTTAKPLSDVVWYQHNWSALMFALASSVSFLLWFITAAHRRIKEVLHCKQYAPWVWACFLLYLIVYLNGFPNTLSNQPMPQVKYQMAFAVSALSTYAVLAYETNEVIRYRLLWKFYQNRQWRHFAENIPLWWVSFSFTIISTLLILSVNTDKTHSVSLSVALISGTLFILRDVGVILYFGLSAKIKHTRLLSVIYLLILYFLLPIFLTSIGLENAAQAFYPEFNAKSYIHILPALLQASCILALLILQNLRLRVSMKG